MGSPIPNLPPISSISDPAVRTYLQALANGWAVRNGTAGDGKEKFLTAADLEYIFSRPASASAALSGVSAAGRSGPVARVVERIADEYRSLVDDIMQSQLYKLLTASIDEIGIPAWFSTHVGAMVKTETEARKTANSALAQQLDTAIAQIDQNIALTRTQIKAVSDLTSANASAVTRLQTQVSGVTAKAEQAFTLAQNIDGEIDAAYSLKVDVNGNAVGFGFGVNARNGVAQSAFGIVANRFFVAPPAGTSGQSRQPFIFENGVAYMDSAFIRTASISSAQIISVAADKIDTRGLLVRDHAGNIILGAGHALDGSVYIRNASVDTLKIAGKAVNDTHHVRADFSLYDGMPEQTWTITKPNGEVVQATGCYTPIGHVRLVHTPMVGLAHMFMWCFIQSGFVFPGRDAAPYIFIMRNRSVCVWAGYIGKQVPRLKYPDNSATPSDIQLLYDGKEGLCATVADHPAGGVTEEYGVFVSGSGGFGSPSPLPGFKNTRFIIDFTLQGLYR